MSALPRLDLVILVPGKDDREVLDGLLSTRQPSLGIRPVSFEILVHPRHDPGCFHEAPDVLQPYQRHAARAFIMFDHEGSGQESRPAGEVGADLSGRLRRSGWGDRAAVIVIEPELEAWVWSDSPEVDAVLGWRGQIPSLREWLASKGLWTTGNPKPAWPKDAMLAALREARVQKSSALFRQLAEEVGLERCQDSAFAQLRNLLAFWFPAGAGI